MGVDLGLQTEQPLPLDDTVAVAMCAFLQLCRA